MSLRLQTVLLNLAVIAASIVQLFRGYSLLIVLICGITFLFTGNLVMYLAGNKARKLRRQQKRDYYAN